jgi:hypothetical protein
MFLDNLHDLTKLLRMKAPGAIKPYGIDPDFCDPLLALHVNVGGLGPAILRVEKQTIGSNTEDGGQEAPPSAQS